MGECSGEGWTKVRGSRQSKRNKWDLAREGPHNRENSSTTFVSTSFSEKMSAKSYMGSLEGMVVWTRWSYLSEETTWSQILFCLFFLCF